LLVYKAERPHLDVLAFLILIPHSTNRICIFIFLDVEHTLRFSSESDPEIGNVGALIFVGALPKEEGIHRALKIDIIATFLSDNDVSENSTKSCLDSLCTGD